MDNNGPVKPQALPSGTFLLASNHQLQSARALEEGEVSAIFPTPCQVSALKSF